MSHQTDHQTWILNTMRKPTAWTVTSSHAATSGFTEKQWETKKMKNWRKPTGEVDIVWHFKNRTIVARLEHYILIKYLQGENHPAAVRPSREPCRHRFAAELLQQCSADERILDRQWSAPSAARSIRRGGTSWPLGRLGTAFAHVWANDTSIFCHVRYVGNLIETIWNLKAQRWYVVCLRLTGFHGDYEGESTGTMISFMVSAGNIDFFLLNGLTFGLQISAIYFYILVPPQRVQNWASGTGRES